jgi:hypothetical protein
VAENSWELLVPKLAPNPQQYKVGPAMVGAMVATTGGVVLTSGSLILLTGLSGIPDSFADLGKESTWRLILGIACLYVLWLVISRGNNFFALYRPAGYSWVLTGAFAFVVVVRDLVTTAMNPEVTGGVLRDPLSASLTLGNFLAGALMLRTGNARFAWARRYQAPVVRNPRDLRGLEYGLYLRTFEQDHVLSGAQPFTLGIRALRSLFVTELPEEGQLADALSSDNVPLVGVGRPGEPAPPVGALRVYLPHEDWKPQVRDLIEGARHVVLALGWGEGTVWELGEAMRTLAPEQLILVVPMEQPEYERFRRETANSLPARLPAYAGREEIRSTIRGLITFSEDWKPTFVPVRAYSPFHNSLHTALIFAAWPALRRLGYPPRGILRLAPNTIR